MPLERLPKGTYDAHHQDFSQCEPYWEPIEVSKAQRFAQSTKETLTLTRPDEDLSFLDWSHIQEQLSLGRAVELNILFIRERTALDKCPLCGSSIPAGTEGLSRRDNQTMICTYCARQEALDEFEGQRG